MGENLKIGLTFRESCQPIHRTQSGTDMRLVFKATQWWEKNLLGMKDVTRRLVYLVLAFYAVH